jgi:hypothetical protein
MKGSCLCGGVTYEVEPPFKLFQYCHCTRCQKFTGSAHASNLFVAPEQFAWLTGAELVSRYEHPEAKYFATCFCQRCGSSLPWEAQGGGNRVIPAGTLDDEPDIPPRNNIYWGSRAPWYQETGTMTKFDCLPARKKR